MKKILLIATLILGLNSCQKEEVETIDVVHILDYKKTICYKSLYNKIKNVEEIYAHLDSVAAKHNVEVLTIVAVDKNEYFVKTLKKPQPKKQFYRLQ